ncbi:MAG: hypothetical protein IK079_02795 [Desulfovibrio sp.]|nr:hypothetical protein [Desulfovibrio sp.]
MRLLCFLLIILGYAGMSWAMPEGSVDRFAQADTDQDKRLSQEEFAKAFPNINAAAFSMLDQNKNSYLEREEWDAFLGKHEQMQTPNKLLIEPPTNK